MPIAEQPTRAATEAVDAACRRQCVGGAPAAGEALVGDAVGGSDYYRGRFVGRGAIAELPVFVGSPRPNGAIGQIAPNVCPLVGSEPPRATRVTGRGRGTVSGTGDATPNAPSPSWPSPS